MKKVRKGSSAPLSALMMAGHEPTMSHEPRKGWEKMIDKVGKGPVALVKGVGWCWVLGGW